MRKYATFDAKVCHLANSLLPFRHISPYKYGEEALGKLDDWNKEQHDEQGGNEILQPKTIGQFCQPTHNNDVKAYDQHGAVAYR